MEVAFIIDIVIVAVCIGGIIEGLRRRSWILVGICGFLLLYELFAYLF